MIKGAWRIEQLQLRNQDRRVDVDANGNLTFVDDVITTSARLDALTRKEMVFFIPGNQAVGANKEGIDIYAPFNMAILNAHIALDTAPTGSDFIVDINKGGTTIFTTQANRPTIVDGANSGTSGTPDITNLVQNDIITIDVDQVGSTTPGTNLTVQVRCRIL